jgi:hypothetical protein
MPQVSQTSAKPTQQADPARDKIAKLLMPQGIKDPEDLNNATAALQTAMTTPNQLKPDQQELLGKLVNPLLKNQGFATAIKQLSAQKPQIGSTPAAGTAQSKMTNTGTPV